MHRSVHLPMMALLLGFSGLLLAVSGCSGAQEKRLADGAWHIRCGEAMNRCTNRADTLCGDRGYHVLGGGTRGNVLGGPSSYRTRVESSELIVRCGEPVEEEVDAPRAEAPTPAQPGTPKDAPGAAPLCIPGSTQTCVGPGGCAGGQACLSDGSGFAACDCGTPQAPPAAPSEAPQTAEPPAGESGTSL